MTLLDVANLSVALPANKIYNTVVDKISFTVQKRETLCIVGESGSGKTMTAKALINLLPKGAKIEGAIKFNNTDFFKHNANTFRGQQIGMIFQEPMTALNPVLSIGRQMTEASVIVGGSTQKQANGRACELLEKVGIAGGNTALRQYPHEFSGGMRQRVMIAMAMMMSPQLMIADEPTTALDVTIQAQILNLLQELVSDAGMGLILITHDMGVVAQNADSVLVMKDGKAVETAKVCTLFSTPSHPYTESLLAAVPRLDKPDIEKKEVTSQSIKPIVNIDKVSKRFKNRSNGLFRKQNALLALDEVSLQLFEGETLALVGESGSGKSTLGRAITRLMAVDSGVIEVQGNNIAALRGPALRKARATTQMIFQDPYSSLDPRYAIGATVAEPMIINGATRIDAHTRSVELLARVGLQKDTAKRFPHEFSGGQRQRIAIARALATNPAVLIADEPTSALDVSIQAQILELLASIKKERGLSMLFISHDLAVVKQIADRVAVMRGGRVIETGSAQQVLSNPRNDYTRLLIESAPIPDPRRRRKLSLPLVETLNQSTSST